ncbi:hypothetical protein NRB_07420 [Novosphingobium sp. 11B]
MMIGSSTRSPVSLIVGGAGFCRAAGGAGVEVELDGGVEVCTEAPTGWTASHTIGSKDNARINYLLTANRSGAQATDRSYE